jgi:hypothetical protein
MAVWLFVACPEIYLRLFLLQHIDFSSYSCRSIDDWLGTGPVILIPSQLPSSVPRLCLSVSNLSLSCECLDNMLVLCRYQHLLQTRLRWMPVPSFLFLMHTHVADLCVTHSEMVHLTFTCEMCSPNCPAYFRQPGNGGGCMLFGRRLVYVHSWFWWHNPVVLRRTSFRRVFREQRGYAAEITNEMYTSQRSNNTQLPPFLGGFRTYPF